MSYKVLIVDDNDTNLLLVSKILQLEGYQTFTTSSGSEAIRMMAEIRPDLAILDVMMPRMNGYELCQRFRQAPLSSKIPIVMLTAMSSASERELALAAGANDVWSKPFDLDVLRQRIHKLLGTTETAAS
jgi:CheY-like chemotaxis protein